MTTTDIWFVYDETAAETADYGALVGPFPTLDLAEEVVARWQTQTGVTLALLAVPWNRDEIDADPDFYTSLGAALTDLAQA